MPFSLFLALKYLKPKRSFVSVVTFISVFGVVLGVAILVIVLSVMTGFDNMWREKILSFKPHLTVTARFGMVEDEETLCDVIESVPGVTGAAGIIESLVLLQHEGRAVAPVVIGVSPDRAQRVSRIPDSVAKRGEGVFDIRDTRAVVGCDLARRLGLRVGSRFLVYSPRNVMNRDEVYLPEELTVAGIFNLGQRDFDFGYVFTSLRVARDLLGADHGARAVYVMTDDAFRFAQYSDAVTKAVGPAFHVQSWDEVDSLMFNALKHEKTLMFVLLVFITIVAIFCVTNTLIVIAVNKTREIGLLKALGFSSRNIMAAFVWHGWIQCLLGTLAGMGLGLLVVENLDRIVRALGRINVQVFPKEIYGLDELPTATSWPELLLVAGLVMGFCTLASILPALHAARLDPVEALHHE